MSLVTKTARAGSVAMSDGAVALSLPHPTATASNANLEYRIYDRENTPPLSRGIEYERRSPQEHSRDREVVRPSSQRRGFRCRVRANAAQPLRHSDTGRARYRRDPHPAFQR